MSKEKETEKIISEKLNSREFAFDEKAWASMENLLDAQEKKRRFGFWWYLSASMFVVLVAGAAWFFMPETDENENKTELATAHNRSATTANPTAMTNHQLATIPNQLAIAANQSVTAANKLAPVSNQSAMVDNELVTTVNEAIITQIEVATTSTEMAMIETSIATTSAEVKMVENEQDSTKTTEQPLVTDSASLAETAKNPLIAPGKETKNAWGIIAGSGYWFAYKTTLATTTDTRFRFTGGIYYQRILSKHWEIELSAIYSGRGALDFGKAFVNTNYGFGILSDKTYVYPKTLHYISVPLSIRFNVTPRSHLYVGTAYYHLLATTSKVTRTVEDSFGVVESSSEKQTGNHSGFRKNDVVAFIGYELTLFERMNIGLQFNYGFYDITKNGYKYGDEDYGVDKTDRNIGLQLQLKYDLICH